MTHYFGTGLIIALLMTIDLLVAKHKIDKYEPTTQLDEAVIRIVNFRTRPIWHYFVMFAFWVLAWPIVALANAITESIGIIWRLRGCPDGKMKDIIYWLFVH